MASNSAKPQAVKVGLAMKKIDSPLAKYNNAGQLTCLVCNVVVKTEKVWTAHVSGRQHREQIEALKKPKSSDNFAKPLAVSAVKRKADSETTSVASPSPSKKGVPSDFFDNKVVSSITTTPKPIKSILKNSSRPTIQPQVARNEIPSDEQMDVDEVQHVTAQVSLNSFKDINEGNFIVNNQTNHIPEGFFDDPKMDAKVRHIDFVDPVEEEWSKFQKEINDEVTVSVAIQEEDQDESTAERQLGEIEEQMLKWGRVLELEQKKEVILRRLQATRQCRPTEEIESSSDEDELEIDKFFDWRSKAT